MVAEHELRLVMETFHFGSGLANLTGDTSVLENVATKRSLHRKIEHCSKGLCDGNGRPPYVMGEYFKVVRQTDEFAIVELEHRPIITEMGRSQGGYVKLCFALILDERNWRVDGAYLDCDGYLPDKYK